MNGWAIGGLACIIYMLVVGGLALKKSPGLIKLVKMKLSKKPPTKQPSQFPWLWPVS